MRQRGCYGRLHREYLKHGYPARYSSLILTGKLWTYLADLNEQAEVRLDLIIEQMKAAEEVTEELKAQNQLEQGNCLEQAGFSTGDKITVKCQQGQLTITKDEPQQGMKNKYRQRLLLQYI